MIAAVIREMLFPIVVFAACVGLQAGAGRAAAVGADQSGAERTLAAVSQSAGESLLVGGYSPVDRSSGSLEAVEIRSRQQLEGLAHKIGVIVHRDSGPDTSRLVLNATIAQSDSSSVRVEAMLDLGRRLLWAPVSVKRWGES